MDIIANFLKSRKKMHSRQAAMFNQYFLHVRYEIHGNCAELNPCRKHNLYDSRRILPDPSVLLLHRSIGRDDAAASNLSARRRRINAHSRRRSSDRSGD